MMLSCAIDGGEPAVAELVQNLGAEGAWAKIIEGVLGEPAAERATRHHRRVRAAGQRRRAFPSYPATTSGRQGLMICDMSRPSSGAVASRSACGFAVQDISLS